MKSDFEQGWRVARSGAVYMNCDGYHIAVWEDRNHPGEWVCGFKPENAKDYDVCECRYASEEAAMQAIYAKLSKALGHSMA